jgi:DNA-binding HxlR family transcriptional regulator
LILFRLGPGRRQFGELRHLVTGVSEKMLIEKLREVQANGIIERDDFKELHPKVEYQLTPLGLTLAKALPTLCDWGSAQSATIEAISGATRPHSVAGASGGTWGSRHPPLAVSRNRTVERIATTAPGSSMVGIRSCAGFHGWCAASAQ